MEVETVFDRLEKALHVRDSAAEIKKFIYISVSESGICSMRLAFHYVHKLQ